MFVNVSIQTHLDTHATSSLRVEESDVQQHQQDDNSNEQAAVVNADELEHVDDAEHPSSPPPPAVVTSVLMPASTATASMLSEDMLLLMEIFATAVNMDQSSDKNNTDVPDQVRFCFIDCFWCLKVAHFLLQESQRNLTVNEKGTRMQRMEERIAHETKDIDADDVGGECSGRIVTRTTLTSSFSDEHGVRCPNGVCARACIHAHTQTPAASHAHAWYASMSWPTWWSCPAATHSALTVTHEIDSV